MKIAITGASGLIGSSLIPFFHAEGHEVIPLKRDSTGEYELPFEGVDLVINLAGETVSQRWSDRTKKEILSSRVNTTSALVKQAIEAPHPPKVFLNASAIGYYGNREEQTVDESSSRGSGFLADVSEAWEQALQPLDRAKIRRASLRFGIVLSTKGGALAKMLTPFKFELDCTG
jgi:uncharacterized protein (TIGR01777 family)